MRRFAGLVLAAAASGAPLRAQSIEAAVSAASVQNHLRFAAAVDEQSGPWVGAEGALRLGKLRLAGAGSLGSLAGGRDGVTPDRQGRATAVSLQLAPTAWFAVGAQVEAKRFDSDVGTTIWRLIGGNVHLAPSFGGPVEGLVDITVWPLASAVQGESMSMALRSVLGATYWFSNRLGARLAYRFERFDFKSEGAPASEPRLEQFRGATLGAVFRLGR